MVRCTAKSKRSKSQCKKWAMKGRCTCHMHGGKSFGPTTEKGKEKAKIAAFRHGVYTKESQTLRREALDLIFQSKQFLKTYISSFSIK